MTSTEVLVVGAGPVGLMAAGELARRGVDVRLLERNDSRSSLSKALVIHARTLEIMDLAGLAGEFGDRGYPAPGIDVGLRRSGKPTPINLRGLDTRFPYMLVLPQRETEAILTRRLESLGVRIETGTEVIGLVQDDDKVTATVRTATGDTQVSARYLLGCDGAHSTVRELVQLPFEGVQLDSTVLIGDVRVDTEFVRSRITNFTSARGFVSILPFLGDSVRIFAVDFARQDRTRDDALSLTELQETVDAISPLDMRLSDPTWLTRYVAPSRQVRTIRVGRTFLAGDATHAHSPAAGQGMNMGLQDAANLSWKLAMVLRREAPAGLLDTYDEERHSVHGRVRHETDRMFRLFTLSNPVHKLVRDLAMRLLIPRKAVQQRLAGAVSGIALSYRQSRDFPASLVARAHRTVIEVGDRVPDVHLWTAGRSEVRLHDLLREPGYALIVHATADRLGRDRARIAKLFADIAALYGDAVRRYLVIDEGVVDREFIGDVVLVDVRGEYARKLGARHGTTIAVRPDGYLAAYSSSLSSAEVAQMLDRWCTGREIGAYRPDGRDNS
ncbi:FAD-dependent oxidoreductase [Kribbella sp. NPDC051936]|uniref:FAD-dependent oxidoreductase n=1 Tax=Kribbella sp. NPDC051936 TaxID=3154946 RepID=UPI00343C8747